jgi:BON domain
MQKSRLLLPVGLVALGLSLLLAAPVLGHQDPQQPDSYSSTPNTQPAPPTSDKPKVTPSDRAIAQKIRRAIYADKTLSTVARQIKVVVQDGKVTLQGSVRSGEERSTILTKAAAVAGEGNVINKIEITHSNR